MGKVAKYKDIEFKHRKYDKNELILSVIFKAVCLILSSLSLYFFVNNHIVRFKDLGNLMTYYEIYLCLFSIVIYAMFFVYELCFLLFKKDNITHGMHILNFINVMALVYAFMCAMMLLPSFLNHGVVLEKEPYFYILEIALPILSVLDLILFNYYFYSVKKYSYYGLTFPTLYFLLFLVLNLFFRYKWPSLINEGHRCDGPYPFLDPKLNHWFTSNYKNIDYTKGIYGFSICSMAIYSIIILVILGVIIIHLKNKRLIKKYDIIIESEVSTFQDY